MSSTEVALVNRIYFAYLDSTLVSKASSGSTGGHYSGHLNTDAFHGGDHMTIYMYQGKSKLNGCFAGLL